jgi:hypothetical protein
MSRATPADDQFGTPVGGRVERSDADAQNRKLSDWGARPSMQDMREHLSLMRRPPVVRERFKSPWTEDADTYPPISELQGDKSKTPEFAMDWHKDPSAPAVGPTGEIDEFAHLTDAQSAAYLPSNPYVASVVGRATGGRYSSLHDTDNPQRISHEFYPEESGMDFSLDRMNPPYSNPSERYKQLFRRSSDSPIDAAFSVLKPEEEVRKILPLIIPAAAAIYGGYQGAKNVRENRITDPVLGVVSREGNDSVGSNLLEFGTGLSQGFGLGAGAKVGSKLIGAGGKKITGKRAAAHQAARNTEREAVRQAARRRAAGEQAGAVPGQPMTPQQQLDFSMYMSPRGRVGSYPRSMGNQAAAAHKYPTTPSEFLHGASQKFTTMGGSRIAPVGAKRLVGGTLLAGAGLMAAGGLGDSFGSGGSGSGMGGGSGSGMGGGGTGQGQFSLAGDPSGGVGNIQNVGVGQTGREQIWQQGGSGTFKGETMTFTHYEGNEMLRKALEDLDKMHCGTEQKAECPKCGKNCKCDEEKKADDGDKKKKPAHGMVIVIGSKGSGPGPSTDGKRDSKD